MRRILVPTTVSLFAVVAVIACGGGNGGAAASGNHTGRVTATGTITGFGSIFVNGVRYDISGADIVINEDDTASEDELALGMVVTVEGILDDDSTGSATSVIYDAEIKGPVQHAPVTDADGETKTFTVLGVTVVANRTTTVFDEGDGVSFSFDRLAQDNVVEVSGFIDAAGSLRATRIELEDADTFIGSTEVKVRGTIQNLDLVSSTFILGAATVSYDGSTEIEVSERLEDGQFVEVEGILTSPGAILATEVELGDDGVPDDDADDVQVEGIIIGFHGLHDFRVNGRPVNASGSIDFEPESLRAELSKYDRVEVEGSVINGVLTRRQW